MSTGPENRTEPPVEEPLPSAAGTTSATPAEGESAKSPEELQRDIEKTREELGDTVDALAEKADVKAQLRGAADEQRARLRAKGEELKRRVADAGGGDGGGVDAEAAAERARHLLDEVARRTSRQPLPYLGGALGAGLLIGLLLRGRRAR